MNAGKAPQHLPRRSGTRKLRMQVSACCAAQTCNARQARNSAVGARVMLAFLSRARVVGDIRRVSALRPAQRRCAERSTATHRAETRAGLDARRSGLGRRRSCAGIQCRIASRSSSRHCAAAVAVAAPFQTGSVTGTSSGSLRRLLSAEGGSQARSAVTLAGSRSWIRRSPMWRAIAGRAWLALRSGCAVRGSPRG